MKHVTMVTYQHLKFAGQEVRWVNFWRGWRCETHYITKDRANYIIQLINRSNFKITPIDNGWIAERRK